MAHILHHGLDFVQTMATHPNGNELILYRQGEGAEAQVHAYRNSCPHLGISLDYGTGNCLLDDGKTLLCAMHAATFEADTGRCTGGPCAGASLKRVAVRVEAGNVVCD